LLTQNRLAYLLDLRNNPRRRSQIQTHLWDGGNGFCAIGLGLDKLGAFPEDPEEYWDSEGEQSYYDQFKEWLDLSTEQSEFVWFLNDAENKTFAQIADELEENWRNY
jgi:hypothetical protein